MKKIRIFKCIAIACLIFFTGLSLHASAAEWWMPRTTLKNDLNIYVAADSGSDVIHKVPQSTALEEQARNESFTWLRVKTHDGIQGYVAKSSVVKFETPLNYLQEKVFEEIKYYRVGVEFYLKAADFCYALPISVIQAQEIGVEHEKSIKDYLDDNGGLKPLTPEQRANCGFEN